MTQTQFTVNAVIYARVSTKDQEREGFSIPAQLDLLYQYAKHKGFEVVQEFKDVETAKSSGRPEFGRMVEYVREQGIPVILVEKTDRMYRNFKDYVTIDDMDVEVHLVKENMIISRDSRSSDVFFHEIRVVMARNFCRNLSEEVIKGMGKKAEQGYYPCRAPLGYVNMTKDGVKCLVPDPVIGKVIRRLFERYATGNFSLQEITDMAGQEGLCYRWTRGGKVHRSIVHKMFNNPMYYGDFRYKGKVYAGKHEPIVSRELYRRAQTVLRVRGQHTAHQRKHRWAFQGLVKCGHCGCAYTAEMKKGKYVYYHCTGNRGKCDERWVREEEISRQFGVALGALQFDDEVVEWIRVVLKDSHVKEKQYHEEVMAALQQEDGKLQNRLDRMYVDRLDGKISDDEYDARWQQWRGEQDGVQRQIGRHRQANRSYLDEGLKIVELAQKAVVLYEQQVMHERRRLLEFLCSNSTYKDGVLMVEYRKPFDLLVVTNQICRGDGDVSGGGNGGVVLSERGATVIEPLIKALLFSPSTENTHIDVDGLLAA